MIFTWELAVISAVYLGIRMGHIEADWRAQRIADKDRRQLPHAWLTLARLFLASIIGLVMYKATWSMVWCTGIMFILIITTHRQSFNHYTKRSYYYMGDPASPKGGSVYDRMFRWLGSKVNGMVELPFWLATVTELLALTGCVHGLLCSLA